MTGPEHYREAQRLLEYGEMDEREPQTVRDDIARAQVHALLALTAATAPQNHSWPHPDEAVR